MKAYTVKKMARLAGVSVRMLHYYDELGLLKPEYRSENASVSTVKIRQPGFSK